MRLYPGGAARHRPEEICAEPFVWEHKRNDASIGQQAIKRAQKPDRIGHVFEDMACYHRVERAVKLLRDRSVKCSATPDEIHRLNVF
jgi:hypothetical protein